MKHTLLFIIIFTTFNITHTCSSGSISRFISQAVKDQKFQANHNTPKAIGNDDDDSDLGHVCAQNPDVESLYVQNPHIKEFIQNKYDTLSRSSNIEPDFFSVQTYVITEKIIKYHAGRLMIPEDQLRLIQQQTLYLIINYYQRHPELTNEFSIITQGTPLSSDVLNLPNQQVREEIKKTPNTGFLIKTLNDRFLVELNNAQPGKHIKKALT